MNALNGQGREPDLLLTLNFHDSSMMLNEGILDALGRPRQVQILLNEEMRRLLILQRGVKYSARRERQ